MKHLLFLLVCLYPTAAAADTLVAARTIRAHAMLSAEDLRIAPGESPGALSTLEDAVGKEARVILYAGRPILPEQVGAPALIERNTLISIVFQNATMRITTEGRALGRAALGERLRVLNIASRTTVTAIVTGPGEATVPNP